MVEVWTEEQRKALWCHDYLTGDAYIDKYENKAAIDAENASRMEDNRMKDINGNYIYDELGNIQLQMSEDRVPLIEYEYMVENYWYYRFLSPLGDVLDEGETPYLHGEHPYVVKAFPLIDGEIPTQGLMLFVPPQHGKSSCVSKALPAWTLGRCPQMKIVGCSYSADLAQQFSRAVQRTIESDEYKSIFPDTQLPSGGRGYQRNVDYFDIVGGGKFSIFTTCIETIYGVTFMTLAPENALLDRIKDSISNFKEIEEYKQLVFNQYQQAFMPYTHLRDIPSG